MSRPLARKGGKPRFRIIVIPACLHAESGEGGPRRRSTHAPILRALAGPRTVRRLFGCRSAR